MSPTLAHMQFNSLSILIGINYKNTKETINTLALIDSGAGGKFINQNYIKKLGLEPQILEETLIAQNMDRTPNKRGKFTSFVDANLTINRRMSCTQLLVTGLGKHSGFPMVEGTKSQYKLANRRI